MTQFVPVTQEAFGDKLWKKPTNYNFARKTASCILGIDEVPSAATAFPVAFVKSNGAYLPVAIFSPIPDHNIFVAQDGAWRGRFVPRHLTTHPFQVVKNEEGFVLFADIESDCIGDVASVPDGQPFFTPEGGVVEELSSLFPELEKQYLSQSLVLELCSLFDELKLLQGWDLKVNIGEEEKLVDGLFCINEDKIASLDDNEFLRLRKNNGLLVTYAQRLSMQNMHFFSSLPIKDKNSGLNPSTDYVLGVESDGNIDLSNL